MPDNYYGDTLAISNKYKKLPSLMDFYSDPLLMKRISNSDLPELRKMPSDDGDTENSLIYIENKCSVVSTPDGLFKTMFLYFDSTGKCKTEYDNSFTCLGKKKTINGFLARYSLPVSYVFPQALRLDYVLDTTAIEFNIDQIIETGIRNTKNITSRDHLEFVSINLFNNQRINFLENTDFNKYISNFITYQEEIFNYFFK